MTPPNAPRPAAVLTAQSLDLAAVVAASGRPLWVYSDGACRGNPGPSGAGWAFCLAEGVALGEGCLFLGHCTNNEAEYMAAACALTAALGLGVQHVVLRADSELMVRQILGIYRVKHARIVPLHAKVMQLAKQFDSFGAEHVLRHRNTLADAMANRAIDGRPRMP